MAFKFWLEEPKLEFDSYCYFARELAKDIGSVRGKEESGFSRWIGGANFCRLESGALMRL